jgi:predicted metalloprotease
MRPSRWAAVVTLFVVGCLTGCATVVVSRPTAPRPLVGQSADVAIVGAVDGGVDDVARNALADLQAYWTDRFPDVFGTAFQPLQGGYFSVDPGSIDPADYPRGAGCGSDPSEVEGNAFYCSAPGTPNSDSISYDRAFLAELAEQFGRFIPALVMAHEFGHAVQARVGSPQSSIATETQADCLAGSWTSWVADGKAQHSRIRTHELDALLRGYLQLRDPVGTSPAAASAHGSFFDRVSAFQEGFDSGPGACRDGFGPGRVFTQGTFSDAEMANHGNLPYPDLIRTVEQALPEFWDHAFAEVFHRSFDPPRLHPFQGDAPSCAGKERDLVYCPDGDVVGYDERDLTRSAYRLGDFAVATAISIPYALAARDQLGLSIEGQQALRSAVCLTGSFGAQVFNGQLQSVQISPGDLDESVQFLLAYGNDPDVLGDARLTGFHLVDVFRRGFIDGVSSCGVRS